MQLKEINQLRLKQLARWFPWKFKLNSAGLEFPVIILQLIKHQQKTANVGVPDKANDPFKIFV